MRRPATTERTTPRGAAVPATMDLPAGTIPSFEGSLVSSQLDNVDAVVPSVDQLQGTGLPNDSFSGLKTCSDDQVLNAITKMRAQVRLAEEAQREKKSLKKLALERSRHLGGVIEKAWESVLGNERTNRQLDALTSAGMMYDEVAKAGSAWNGKIFVGVGSPEEMGTIWGETWLRNRLAERDSRPDPRRAFAFVAVYGWVGKPDTLKTVLRITHEFGAFALFDVPRYTTFSALRAASNAGGVLSKLAGGEVPDRHGAALGNPGYIDLRFDGRTTSFDVRVSTGLALPFLGAYLGEIARGTMAIPPVGAESPLAGIDGVELDLLLQPEDSLEDGHQSYIKNKVIPAIPTRYGDNESSLWGQTTLFRGNKEVLIGEAVVELTVARYARWRANMVMHGRTLEDAKKILQQELSDFVTTNRGYGKMFKDSSEVHVDIDTTQNALLIHFEIDPWTSADRVFINITKPTETGGRSKTMSVQIESRRSPR